MPRRSAVEAGSFDEVVGRLDEIVAAVRSKDTSLEDSLDLLDEAIELGLSAVELVDSAQPEPAGEAQPAAGGAPAGADR